MIKPIETIYKGYRFRSRLEARWAVFFDTIGADWEYEPEGFDLGNGLYYLPDFRIHNCKGFCKTLWVEVKSTYNITDLDKKKIEAFYKPVYCGCDENQCRPLLVVGDIPFGDNINDIKQNICKAYNESYNLLYSLETISSWCDCQFPAAAINGGFYLCRYEDFYDDKNIDHERTEKAYLKSLQARFEHGEKPF